jgi:hypothetical protein
LLARTLSVRNILSPRRPKPEGQSTRLATSEQAASVPSNEESRAGAVRELATALPVKEIHVGGMQQENEIDLRTFIGSWKRGFPEDSSIIELKVGQHTKPNGSNCNLRSLFHRSMSDFFTVSPRTRNACEELRREMSTREMDPAQYKEVKETPLRKVENTLRSGTESSRYTSNYQRAQRRHSASSCFKSKDGFQELLDAYDKIANFNDSREFVLDFGSEDAIQTEQGVETSKIHDKKDSGGKALKGISWADFSHDETEIADSSNEELAVNPRGFRASDSHNETDSSDETDFDDEEDEQRVSYLPSVAPAPSSNWVPPKSKETKDLEASQLSLFDATGWE